MIKRTTVGTNRCGKNPVDISLTFSCSKSLPCSHLFLFSFRSLKITKTPQSDAHQNSRTGSPQKHQALENCPSEISLGTSDIHGKRCRVVELAPLLPLWVTFLPFISFGKKYCGDHQLLSSALSCTYFGLYSVESVPNINQKKLFFSPLCSTQVPKEMETTGGWGVWVCVCACREVGSGGRGNKN